MIHSIRSRVIVGSTLAVFTVWFAAVALLDHLVSVSLVGGFDTSLSARARMLTTLVEEENGRLEFDGRNAPEFRTGADCEYFEMSSISGETLERSPSLGSARLALPAEQVDASRCHSVTLPDGRPGRQVQLVFHPRPADEGEVPSEAPDFHTSPVVLRLARSTLELQRTLHHLRLLLLGVGGLATVLSVGLLAAVARKGLAPLTALAGRIDTLGETDLRTLVELPGAPAELLPVIDRLNDLLRRLEAAFSRERAFSADIAHELRTPLAGLRSTLEVSLARPRETDAYRNTLSGALAITCQMQQMTDTLLSLARNESGQVQVASEPVDLEELLRQAWQVLAPAAASRQLAVTWELHPCRLESDRGKLLQLITNVLDNAVTYADQGGRIWIRVDSADDTIRLVIRNTGCRLTPDQIGHVFERFWRADPSRQNLGMHSGLGLALCRRITRLLGGEIAARTVEGVFELMVSLPVNAGGARAHIHAPAEAYES